MKKKLLLLIGSCLLFTACDLTIDRDDAHYHIRFYNASVYNAFIGISFDYPDTTLRNRQDVTTPGWYLGVESHNSNNDALASMTSYESIFYSIDTLIIFVFNADTLSARGWDNVKEHNIVTQRYDLSLSDLYNLDWRLTFPPTEEMRNIKMWPPYGTYDSHGHRIE